MAINGAQLNQLLQAESTKPYSSAPERFIGDNPSEDGMIILKRGEELLKKSVRHQASAYDTAMGLDIVANPNAIQTQQQGDRDRACKHLILSFIHVESMLYRTLSNARFTTGRQCWTYLNAPDVVYTAPSAASASSHKLEVAAYTWMSLPREQQNKFMCVNFMTFLLSHNPKLHPSFNMTTLELIQIFCFGIHPQAKVEALHLFNNNAAAVAAGVVYPANYPAYDPEAGNAHPLAGQLDPRAFALHISKIFQDKYEAGIFVLNIKPALNVVTDDVVSEAPVPGPDTSSDFLFVSMADVVGSHRSEWSEYLLSVQRVQPDFRTCNNCGGVGHFSFVDGKFVCPTPQGTVPSDLLRQIKYPFGVRPWNFGKGKGKGKGRGRGDGRGRGRGHYQTYYIDDEGAYHAVDAPAAPAAPAPSAADEPGPSDINASFEGVHVDDDWNWNQW